MEDRLQVMLKALDTTQAALSKFYGSLSDEQKARFDRMSVGRPDGGAGFPGRLAGYSEALMMAASKGCAAMVVARDGLPSLISFEFPSECRARSHAMENCGHKGNSHGRHPGRQSCIGDRRRVRHRAGDRGGDGARRRARRRVRSLEGRHRGDGGADQRRRRPGNRDRRRRRRGSRRREHGGAHGLGVRAHRLRVQQCGRCGAFRRPGRSAHP